MKRPFKRIRPICPLYATEDSQTQTICEQLKSSDRARFALEEIIDITRDTEREAAVLLYQNGGHKWFKTNSIVGKESEISNDLTSDIMKEVPDDADKIVLVHTHPSGLAELSPQDMGLFIDFIDYFDASLVLADYQDTVTLSGLEKTKSRKRIYNESDVGYVEFKLVDIIEDVSDGKISPREAMDESHDLVESEDIARSCSTTIEGI